MSRPPTLLVVPDGMADWPQEKLGGLTPWEAADTRNLDRFCEEGRSLRLQNIPDESPADSGIANMALLGYDPREYYLGRGALEALNLGLELKPDEIAYRCNLVSVDAADNLVDYSAGNIETDIAAEIFTDLQSELGNEKIRFSPGVRYRGILILNGVGEVNCVPPHDEMGRPVGELWPRGEGADRLKQLMIESRGFLKSHYLNKKLQEAGNRTADMIWPWGGGKLKQLPRLQERYNLEGRVIAGVDLIKGLGLAIGMDKVEVPGATGDFDTNMAGKAKAALESLAQDRLVYLHLEAPDEAGHDGAPELKKQMIEKFDREILGPLWNRWQEESFNLAIGPDHYTPIQERTHVKEPVPFLVLDGDKNEYECSESGSRQAPFVARGWEKIADWYANDEKFNF